jgi:hypothetical protein
MRTIREGFLQKSLHQFFDVASGYNLIISIKDKNLSHKMQRIDKNKNSDQ